MDDDKKVETTLTHNENSNNEDYYEVSHLESDDEVEEHLFEEQMENEIKATPK